MIVSVYFPFVGEPCGRFGGVARAGEVDGPREAAEAALDQMKRRLAGAAAGGFFAGDLLSASTGGTSITTGYNSSTGVLTLSGLDTFAHYQSVLASVQFTWIVYWLVAVAVTLPGASGATGGGRNGCGQKGTG